MSERKVTDSVVECTKCLERRSVWQLGHQCPFNAARIRADERAKCEAEHAVIIAKWKRDEEIWHEDLAEHEARYAKALEVLRAIRRCPESRCTTCRACADALLREHDAKTKGGGT